MEKVLLAVAILLPALSAALCYIIRHSAVRKFIVVVSTLLLFIVAGGFVNLLLGSNGRITIAFGDEGLSSIIHMAVAWAIKLLDLALLVYVIFIGFRLRKALIVGLAALQLIPLILFEVFVSPKETATAFVIDYLTLIMILLVSVIGPIITVFALGYMKEHEHHLGLKKSRQPRFFMILFAFLAAMNALVITNDLSWMYFFWEVTTLCSFLLISHDGTTESFKNAIRALWINLLGGVGFIGAIIALYYKAQTLAIDEILLKVKSPEDVTGFIALGLGLLCFAGFTKAAQFPFQSWLLGAMVAPTPVSALLHSSTMVKAGVYLIVRLAPAFQGTVLGKVVAVVGGFTFLAGSAIAISQSNAKRVLAYSTIANLGLIICCAGIGSPAALGAAILLIVFHALSKGLLFLCVGTIEQEIGSRDIEDMQGLMKRMPFTTIITVIGAVSMLLPPFGVMLTKWAAIEASVALPIVLILIVLGSAFTVVFWSKWIGIMLTMSYKEKYNVEKLPFSIRSSLLLLVIGVLTASVGVEQLFNTFVKPWLNAGDVTLFSGFAPIWFFIVLFAVVLTVPFFLRGTKSESIKPPYLCGENIDNDIRGLEFISPGDKAANVVVRNYYLSGFFGEKNLTLWTNLLAGAIILVMFGVVIK